jgi:molybdopterin-guanine dinucleotide biosynthesis protein A
MIDATGFITAAGRSSRMGKDKAWLELGGRAMIEHVIAALVPVTTRVAIIANSLDYERLGFPVFADSHAGIGPLEAIRTALSNALASRVVLVGCDLPFVTSDLFKLLLSIPGDHYATVPVCADGKLEPLCALPAVTNLITQGERKVSPLFDRVPTRVVPFDELRDLLGSELFFENINTPDDYARAIETLRPKRSKTP